MLRSVSTCSMCVCVCVCVCLCVCARARVVGAREGAWVGQVACRLVAACGVECAAAVVLQADASHQGS